MSIKKTENTSLKKESSYATAIQIWQTNFTLGFGKAFACLPTQPLQVVMRVQQRTPNLSLINAIKLLYNQPESPFKSFYKGIGPAGFKEFTKNFIYKGWLLQGSLRWSEQFLNYNHIDRLIAPDYYRCVHIAFASLGAAGMDTLLGGAFDNWATYAATSVNEHSNKSFRQELKNQPTYKAWVQQLYRGAGPTFAKNMVMYCTMFSTKDSINNMTASFYGISSKEEMTWYAMLTAAVLSGFTVGILSAPLDIIKTQTQMPGSKGLSLWNALSHNIKTYGLLKTLTAGLPAKVMMTTIGWGINFFVTQQALGLNSHTSHTPTSRRPY